jgi:hypothetical protein
MVVGRLGLLGGALLAVGVVLVFRGYCAGDSEDTQTINAGLYASTFAYFAIAADASHWLWAMNVALVTFAVSVVGCMALYWSSDANQETYGGFALLFPVLLALGLFAAVLTATANAIFVRVKRSFRAEA